MWHYILVYFYSGVKCGPFVCTKSMSQCHPIKIYDIPFDRIVIKSSSEFYHCAQGVYIVDV